MPEWTQKKAGMEAAKANPAKSGEPKAKRGPGRPKGAGKRGPGRPKGSGKGPGRPKGKRGRPKGSTAKTVSLKGYVKQREAKRMVKEAVRAFKAKLPRLITKELKKLLR
ncbi:MAG: hypothetical protein ACREKE_09540 [bacterium]